MGNKDGTMDGHRLPSRERFMHNLARYPSLRVTLVPGESALAAPAAQSARPAARIAADAQIARATQRSINRPP